MYFNTEQQRNILHIDDTYATLTSIDGEMLTFDFRYSVSQTEVIRSNAMAVKLTVYTKTVAKRSLMGTSHTGQIDSQELVNNILTDMTAAKTALKNQDNYTLCTKYSDITSKISNEVASKLNTIDAVRTQQFTRTKLVTRPAGSLKRSNDEKPVLHVLLSSDSTTLSTKELCTAMIIERGIDPSSVIHTSSNVLSANRSVSGMKAAQSVTLNDDNKLLQLRNTLTQLTSVSEQKTSADVDDQTMVNVLVAEQDDEVSLTITTSFSSQTPMKTLDETDSVFVKFQLLRVSTGETVDVVTKTLPISQHIKTFLTPVKVPRVKVIRSDVMSKVNLEIRQSDEIADAINLYSKNVHVASTDIEPYTLVGTINVKGKESAIFPVNYPLHDSCVYRVIPTRSGNVGNSYTNVVVRPHLAQRCKVLSLTTKIIDTGVLIEARTLPTQAISVQFMQRNLTTHEEEFTSIDEPQLITDAVRASDYVSMVSPNVMNNHVYEFIAKVYQRTGESVLMGSDIIEYIASTSGKVNIRVQNLTVSHDSADPDVTFNVTIDSIDGDLDVVRKLLGTQDIQKYYDLNVEQQREQLKNLFTYSIDRIDVTTGERVNMGILTDSSFSDKAIRSAHSIDPLRYGHVYRYVITALSRTPETLLSSITRTMVDATTKKKYTLVPSKSLHPITLREGTIVSDVGLKTRYSKATFEHGNLGTATTVDVTLDVDNSKIIEASVNRFDYSHNIVTWRTAGDLTDIDHFVIMKEIHGVRTILGVTHNQFVHNNCKWIHDLTRDDNGELRYVIIAVTNDYKYGDPVYTNSMLVEVQ